MAGLVPAIHVCPSLPSPRLRGGRVGRGARKDVDARDKRGQDAGVAKGSNLCHGAGGNGYVFLKLHRRTADPVWLERARVRHDGHSAMPRGARTARPRPILALDGRCRPGRLPVELLESHAALPNRRHLLSQKNRSSALRLAITPATRSLRIVSPQEEMPCRFHDAMFWARGRRWPRLR
jgi:hypothetical protein